MTKYAQYNPNAAQPAPVIGWFDTDMFDYAQLPGPEQLVEITDEQWDDRMDRPSEWAIDNGQLVRAEPPSPPEPTIDDVLADKIADGIAITSLSNPEGLNCTMALDSVTMDQIGAVARDAASGMGLPAGAPIFVYPDINGVPRVFSEAQVIGLYKAQRDLLYAMNTQAAIERNGGTAVWPEQIGNIP